MSRNQKPRWPQIYPRMKQRGKGRRRRPRIVLRDSDWNPIWPPVLMGQDIRGMKLTFTSGDVSRRLEDGGLWVEDQ